MRHTVVRIRRNVAFNEAYSRSGIVQLHVQG